MPRKLDLDEKVRALRNFYRLERRLPGYAEMLVIFEYRSKNAVFALLRKLEAAGYLRRDVNGKYSPTRKLTGLVKVLGKIEAGFPAPAEEELLDTLSLDEFLIKKPDVTYLLRVSGHSMRDAGIQPNDIVLVERNAHPQSGSIVVAQVDGEWTLKYYAKDKEGIVLEPANPDFHPIRPQQTLSIGGVVRAVIRKYE